MEVKPSHDDYDAWIAYSKAQKREEKRDGSVGTKRKVEKVKGGDRILNSINRKTEEGIDAIYATASIACRPRSRNVVLSARILRRPFPFPLAPDRPPYPFISMESTVAEQEAGLPPRKRIMR